MDVSYLRMKEVIVLMRISKSTVYSWIQQGIFPKPTKIGRVSLWNKEEVLNFINK
jgi:excisionase family DNA binding protein